MAFLLLAACGGGMALKKPEQGLYGAFIVYGPPAVMLDCASMVTQFDKDSCRHQNERILEEPYRSVIRIRNVGNGETVDQPLDAQGSYRTVLAPGEYEVCVHGECSDPIEVRMRTFTTYGQRLPKPAADAPRAPDDAAKARRPDPDSSAP